MSRLPHRPPPYSDRPLGLEPLGYYRRLPGEKTPAVPTAVQFLIGLLALNACVCLATIFGFTTRHGDGASLAIGVALLVLAIWLRLQLHWRGFIPGALAGLLLAPVTFFFTCMSMI